MFSETIFFLTFQKKHCIIRTKKLHKIKLKKYFFNMKNYKKYISFYLFKAKKHFQLCLAPIETPQSGTYL